MTTNCRWTLWSDERVFGSDIVRNRLVKLGDFSLVPDLEKLATFNVSTLRNRSVNFRFFRSGIKPVFEAPENIHGGKWVITCPPSETKNLWLNISSAVLGEGLDSSDSICGIVLSFRAKRDMITVWNREAKNPATIRKVGHQLAELCWAQRSVKYFSHRWCLRNNEVYRSLQDDQTSDSDSVSLIDVKDEKVIEFDDAAALEVLENQNFASASLASAPVSNVKPVQVTRQYAWYVALPLAAALSGLAAAYCS
jgi:hypothetical protein